MLAIRASPVQRGKCRGGYYHTECSQDVRVDKEGGTSNRKVPTFKGAE